MAILRWKRSTGWLAVGLAGLCTLLLLWLIGSAAFDKDSARWAKGILFLVGATSIAATLLASDDVPWRARTLRTWFSPKPVAIAFTGVLAAFGAMTDALSLFEPRPAVESTPGAVEAKLDSLQADVRGAIGGAGQDARIWKVLPGLWGEPGCDVVTYRFAIRGNAVVVDSGKQPSGEEPYHLIATIQNASGDKMDVRGETPREAQGKAASFTYVTNGVVEGLRWDDHVPDSPAVELERCE